MERERCIVAENGIKIYGYRNAALHSFFISLFVRAGSMYETERDAGITHFLEHVAIRNVNYLMGGSLYPTLDREGIEFNASTFSEMIQFYVSGSSEKIFSGAEILSRLFSPISLPSAEIAAERERIKAEIRESDDKSSLSTFAAGLVYEGTSLARSITGTAGTVSRITRARLEAYRRSVFTPENLFVYVTGAFTDEDLEGIARLIGSAPVFSGERHENIAPVCEKFGKREGKAAVKNADFTMVRLNFDLDMSRASSSECDIIYDILLGGYNSRFFIEMSERRGLCYDVTGSVERYKNIGSLAITYEVKEAKLYESVELSLGLLTSLATAPLSESDIMKAGYVTNAKMLYDDPRDTNFTFAYDNHVMSEGYKSIEERAELYGKITPERICEVADTVFRPENLTLTVKGKKKRIDTERLEGIIKNFRK